MTNDAIICTELTAAWDVSAARHLRRHLAGFAHAHDVDERTTEDAELTVSEMVATLLAQDGGTTGRLVLQADIAEGTLDVIVTAEANAVRDLRLRGGNLGLTVIAKLARDLTLNEVEGGLEIGVRFSL